MIEIDARDPLRPPRSEQPVEQLVITAITWGFCVVVILAAWFL